MESNYKKDSSFVVDASFYVIGSTAVGEGWKNKAAGGNNRMYYINGGTGGYIVKGQEVRFQSGMIYFLPYYSNFSLFTDLEDNLDVTFADFKLLNPVLSSTVFSLSPDESPLVSSAINTFKILCCTKNRNEDEKRYLKQTIEYLISVMVSTQPQRLINDQTIINALNYIHSSFSEKISVADIAEKCFLSVDGFIRRFIRSVGEPPYSYLKKLRLQTALSMRAEGQRLTEIAEACGYDNPSSLLHAIASEKKK